MQPNLPLGVPLMDADHAILEAMFERVPVTRDDELPALFMQIEAEVIAHFAREEQLMAEHDAPVAHCHHTQHALLLAEFSRARSVATGEDAEALRLVLAQLEEFVAGHVASVDRVTAQFLGGTLDTSQVERLRLPE